MASTTKLKRRFKTVSGLNSIFNAMQVITTVRMGQARQRHSIFSDYLAGIEQAACKMNFSPFLREQKAGENVVILLSTNRGLCGGFNFNLFANLQGLIGRISAANNSCKVIAIGKKGDDFARSRRLTTEEAHLKEDYAFAHFKQVTDKLLDDYRVGKISAVYVVFNRFKSVMRQDARAYRLLAPEVVFNSEDMNVLLEPDKYLLSEKTFRLLLAARLFHFYLESKLGEACARMVTLKGAVESSKEIIDSLSRDMNKMRQASITAELLELIGSSMGMYKGEE
ncbi:MAG: FoF1 ATP synthase subunit gamma [Candidatus Margulisiibacteriota bacterium]